MNREEYLRELDSAGSELNARARDLAEAANPLHQLRSEIARDWRWWMPCASVAGFAAALLLRPKSDRTQQVRIQGVARSGAAFWVPTLLKLLPAAVSQLIPLLLSLRSGRKP
jgi:hypothetical protein